ncbi:HAD-IA family hydrolase [Risungbinella massiliensis]|uniref:HAD-IA family hydrolase n=1 Tax=Risungbinella massiliensis TaxID=1329796 RepID=UPI000699EB8A|nr:HAD-IA family hydrolase [Risungbinella massiliensis]
MKKNLYHLYQSNVPVANLKVLLFDLDGTLYPASAIENKIGPTFFGHAKKVFQLDAEQTYETIQQYRKEFHHVIFGLKKYYGIDPDTFYADVFESLDISAAEPYNGLIDILHECSKYYKLALWTNSSRGHAKRLLEKFSCLNLFSYIFSLEDFNYYKKPNREGFEMCLEKLKESPKNVLFFDDSYLNLKTAKIIGLNTVLVSNHIVEPPYFWEMHRKEKHFPQSFVDYNTHNLTEMLEFILNERKLCQHGTN